MAGSLFSPESINLEGYKVIDGRSFSNKFQARGIALTINDTSMNFTKAAAKALGNCEFVTMLQNDATKCILIRSATSNEEYSFRWFNPNNGDTLKKRNEAIIGGIVNMMNWKKEKLYIVDGTVAFAGNSPVLLFDLKRATEHEKKQYK